MKAHTKDASSHWYKAHTFKSTNAFIDSIKLQSLFSFFAFVLPVSVRLHIHMNSFWCFFVQSNTEIDWTSSVKTALSLGIHYAVILKILKSKFQINCEENEIVPALLTKARSRFLSSTLSPMSLHFSSPTLLWWLPHHTLYSLFVLQTNYPSISSQTIHPQYQINIPIEIQNKVEKRKEKL